jgi:hypothetical protein
MVGSCDSTRSLRPSGRFCFPRSPSTGSTITAYSANWTRRKFPRTTGFGLRWSGRPWTTGHIKAILRCPAYVGTFAIGYGYQWKKYETHGNCDATEKRDACPALIDEPTWRRAFDRLQAQAEKGPGRRAGSGTSSPLSGVIYCGHCGRPMAVSRKRGVTRFVCSTASRNSAVATCHQWTVQEADILPVMTEALVSALDGEVIAKMQAEPPEGQAKELEALDAQAAALEKRVAKAARNLADADPEIYDDVQAALKALRRELDTVKNTAHVIRAAGDKTELQRVADWWTVERPKLVTVVAPQEVLSTPRTKDGKTVQTLPPDFLTKVVGIKAEADVFRGLLKRLNAKVTLHFAPKAGTKRYFAVEWGRMTAEIEGHTIDATRPASTRAPAARPCASRCNGPAPSSRPASATGWRATPGWTAGSSGPTSTCPTRA